MSKRLPRASDSATSSPAVSHGTRSTSPTLMAPILTTTTEALAILPGRSVMLQLKRAEHLLRSRLRPTLDDAGLSVEHWQILAALLAHPGMRMSDLAEAALLAPASLTRHVDRLVERAFVVRRIDVNDKRSLVVALSSMGQSLAERLEAVEQITRDDFAGLIDLGL